MVELQQIDMVDGCYELAAINLRRQTQIMIQLCQLTNLKDLHIIYQSAVVTTDVSQENSQIHQSVVQGAVYHPSRPFLSTVSDKEQFLTVFLPSPIR